MTASRLSTGGTHIDRSTAVAFEFDGQALTGFDGDTIASALLANGIDVVGRSIYHDRPRGIVSAGPEEPNALVQVRWPDGASEPMLPATTVLLQDGLVVSSLAGARAAGDRADGRRRSRPVRQPACALRGPRHRGGGVGPQGGGDRPGVQPGGPRPAHRRGSGARPGTACDPG